MTYYDPGDTSGRVMFPSSVHSISKPLNNSNIKTVHKKNNKSWPTLLHFDEILRPCRLDIRTELKIFDGCFVVHPGFQSSYIDSSHPHTSRNFQALRMSTCQVTMMILDHRGPSNLRNTHTHNQTLQNQLAAGEDFVHRAK